MGQILPLVQWPPVFDRSATYLLNWRLVLRCTCQQASVIISQTFCVRQNYLYRVSPPETRVRVMVMVMVMVRVRVIAYRHRIPWTGGRSPPHSCRRRTPHCRRRRPYIGRSSTGKLQTQPRNIVTSNVLYYGPLCCVSRLTD